MFDPLPDDKDDEIDGFGGRATGLPGEDYIFAGYFPVGSDDEVIVGVYVKPESAGLSSDATQNPYTDTLDLLDELNHALQKLTPYNDVPEDARREATAYLTILEAFERGSRINAGVHWGIYYRDGAYHLWVSGSP